MEDDQCVAQTDFESKVQCVVSFSPQKTNVPYSTAFGKIISKEDHVE